jgi:hypothetical protein
MVQNTKTQSVLRWFLATFIAIAWLTGFTPSVYSSVAPDVDESLFKNYYISSDVIKDADREKAFQMLRKQLDAALPLRKLLLLNERRLKLLRNEIYARQGYIFESPELMEYFRSMPWYKPDPNFTETLFSNIDKQNVELIKKYEAAKNELSFESKAKHAGRGSWVDKLDKSQKQLNPYIEKTKNGIRFKQSNKELSFQSSKIKENVEGRVYEYVDKFQEVETFKDTSIIFVRTWRFIRMMGNRSERVDAYDIDGVLLFSMNLSQKDIWYDKENDLFISEIHENWSGETSGSICIFSKQGNILFNENAYGVEFIMPHWSNLKLIYVPSSWGKLVAIDQSGQILYQPIFTFPNLNETYGAGKATKRKIAMIAPNVIYWAGINDYWPEEKDTLLEGLIFLDQYGPAREDKAKKIVKINWSEPRPDKSKKQLNSYIEEISNGIRFKSTGKEVFFYKEMHRDKGYKNSYNIIQLFQDVETFKTTSIVLVRTWFSSKTTPPDPPLPPEIEPVKIDGYDTKGNLIFSINMPHTDIWYKKENDVFISEGSIYSPTEKSIFDTNGNTLIYQKY